MITTLTRSQVKVCLRALLNEKRGVPPNTPLILRIRSIDKPLPCKMEPVSARQWLAQKVTLPLNGEEIDHLKTCLKMSPESDSIDVLDLLEE